ncbi:hypothetical protein EDB80DRAFT_881050 [Ilyonectria destructans]|nr:hypothetical protein EDB80DRAFT_881050 [Ilyonectria destructans]
MLRAFWINLSKFLHQDGSKFFSAALPRADNSTPRDNEYLAKPSGACCVKDTIHKAEPRGKWETITDVKLYIATPPDGKDNRSVLLYFPDVLGMFPDGILVMDAFANARDRFGE